MNQLEAKAKHIRELILTALAVILTALAEAGSGHTGGSLDLVDVFTVLYFDHLRHDPQHPNWEGRDKVVLSIGHTAPVLYATLAAAGYFPSSGSLGQGLGVAMGMAMAAKMDGKPNRVFCIMGDGEQQEGSVWESAMAAAHYRLDNLCAIIDRNRLQSDGRTEKVMAIDPLRDKWTAFGWHTLEIDGHDMSQIKMALDLADKEQGRPTVIIADTVMGKGVKSIEDNNQWHGKVPTKEQLHGFLNEL